MTVTGILVQTLVASRQKPQPDQVTQMSLTITPHNCSSKTPGTIFIKIAQSPPPESAIEILLSSKAPELFSLIGVQQNVL